MKWGGGGGGGVGLDGQDPLLLKNPQTSQEEKYVLSYGMTVQYFSTHNWVHLSKILDLPVPMVEPRLWNEWETFSVYANTNILGPLSYILIMIQEICYFSQSNSFFSQKREADIYNYIYIYIAKAFPLRKPD